MSDGITNTPGSEQTKMSAIDLNLPPKRLFNFDLARPRENDFAAIGLPRMKCSKVSVHYGEKLAVSDASLNIMPNEVLALIGPSGCGKSTLLRCLNRMNDTIPGCAGSTELSLWTIRTSTPATWM